MLLVYVDYLYINRYCIQFLIMIVALILSFLYIYILVHEYPVHGYKE